MEQHIWPELSWACHNALRDVGFLGCNMRYWPDMTLACQPWRVVATLHTNSGRLCYGVALADQYDDIPRRAAEAIAMLDRNWRYWQALENWSA